MIWKYTLDLLNLLSAWTHGWERQIISIHNRKEWINGKYLLPLHILWLGMDERKTSWSSRVKGGWCEKGWLLSQTEWPMYLRSGWWILNVIYQGQFRQANSNISVWNPKTFYPWFWRHNSAALSITKQSRSSYTWVASCCHVELHLYKKFLPVSENIAWYEGGRGWREGDSRGRL